MGDRLLPCLSVQQPWAGFIFGDASHLALPRFKDVENRTWQTKYRGPLLVHASKKLDSEAWTNWGSSAEFKRHFLGMPGGVILGVVDLVDVVTDSDSPWSIDGCYHWVLQNPRRFESPVPWVGGLGLRSVPVSALGGQL